MMLRLFTASIVMVLILAQSSCAREGQTISKLDGMKPEWFTCTTSDDCALVEGACGIIAGAANVNYRQAAEDVFCRTVGCASTACFPPDHNFVALCVNNQCTKSGPDQHQK